MMTCFRHFLGWRRQAPLVCGVWMSAVLLCGSGPLRAEDPPPPKPPQGPDDLSTRLIRKAVTETDEDVMDSIVRLMGDSAKKMVVEFDPGEKTQTVQDSIQQKLNDAIKAAAARTKMRRQAPTQQSDRRKMPSGKRDPKQRPFGRESRPGSARESSDSDAQGGAAQTPDGERVGLHDPRRGWGDLPQRQREEIIQGASEDSLERFRIWVERYYRALQEKND